MHHCCTQERINTLLHSVQDHWNHGPHKQVSDDLIRYLRLALDAPTIEFQVY
jgi:hypothetical protein